VKGKLVLIPFPFTDLTSTKLRPALVLMEGDRDCVVAFISSKMATMPSPNDILVPQTHEEFTRTGLKKTSVIKLDKIATISKDLIVGELGELGEALRREVNTRLREAYQL
jgi:mRNA interferase MazF